VSSVHSDAASVDQVSAVAQRFLSARRLATGLPEYPGQVPTSLEQAYAIQDAAMAGWGRPAIGWKVGRINPPLSQRYGADRLAGPMFDARMAKDDGSLVDMPVFDQGSAAAEAEFLLRVGRSPETGRREFSLGEAAELIDAVHVGIEIASSPLVDINGIGPTAVISDFGNNNGVLIGPAIPNWRESGLEDWDVTTLIDGQVVGTGRGSAFPDGVIGSARFLFELLAERRIRIEAGQWISSGAVTGVHDAHAGQLVEAKFKDGLAVRCRLIPANPE
jgi:2-keto-4-pentenoate hydratase